MLDIDKLLITTGCATFEDYPWVTYYAGLEIRVLQIRPSADLMAIQVRAQPFCVGTPHKHQGLTFGFTSQGWWGHNPGEYHYGPNSYICEPTDELHRFCNGPEVTVASYVNIGYQEYFDESGCEVIRRSTPEDVLKKYLALCEEIGVRRPNVLV